MSKVILRGDEAIHYAEEHGLRLNESEDDQGGPRQGISVEEARAISDRAHASGDESHIWLEINAAVNTAE